MLEKPSLKKQSCSRRPLNSPTFSARSEAVLLEAEWYSTWRQQFLCRKPQPHDSMVMRQCLSQQIQAFADRYFPTAYFALRLKFVDSRRFGQPRSWPAAKPIKKNKNSVDISRIRYNCDVTWQLKHCGGTCNGLSVLGAHDLSLILQIQLGHTTKLFPVHHASCLLNITTLRFAAFQALRSRAQVSTSKRQVLYLCCTCVVLVLYLCCTCVLVVCRGLLNVQSVLEKSATSRKSDSSFEWTEL